MARLITVHGTFAQHESDTGEIWWQKESPFAKRLLGLLESENGEIVQEPVHWSGDNSETARREAGTKLAQRMTALEKDAIPYAVIGHSHGGSIISAALMECAKRTSDLPKLGAWITVGSPFITTRRGAFLFHRLGNFGKSAFAALFTIFLVIMTTLFVPETFSKLCPSGNVLSPRCGFSILLATGLFSSLLLAFYVAMRVREHFKLHLYSKRVIDFAARNFRSRWVALWHPNDEAIQGLGSLRSLNPTIFPGNFAVKPMTGLSFLFLPLSYLLMINIPSLMRQAFSFSQSRNYNFVPQFTDAGTGGLLDNGNSFVINNQLMIDFIGSWVSDLLMKLFHIQAQPGSDAPIPVALLTYLLIFLMAIGVALIFTYLFRFIAGTISSGISRTLNPLTMQQIRAQAYGSDTQEDYAIDAANSPMWLGGKGMPHLPAPLADEVQTMSDDAVRKVIPRFRNLPREFAQSGGTSEATDMLASYLTWEELIHTTYFNNARFTKLVAYAICQGPGFRPSAAFKSDPDFALIAGWYDQLTGKSTAGVPHPAMT